MNTKIDNNMNTNRFLQNDSDNINLEDIIYVITRTGEKEPLSTDKIVKRLQILSNQEPKINHINPYELMLEVSQKLTSGISTYEIDEFAGNVAASLSVRNPNYMKLAGRIIIDNHQRITDRSFVDKMRKAYLRKDENGKVIPMISSEFFKYVEEHQDRIENMIDYKRDFLIDFFGFKTFKTIYSLKINNKSIERPQDLFMRVAIALNMNTINKNVDLNPAYELKNPAYELKNVDLDPVYGLTVSIDELKNIDLELKNIDLELKNIKTTYDMLSLKLYTHASPTNFNAGLNHPQYSSCFLLGSEDSRLGIMHTADSSSQISKYGGGIGIHIHNWRGKNSVIRGTNGLSEGIVPFLKIYNEVMKAFNQGGRRPGSAAIYLMPHHPDIEDFLKLKLPNGIESDRARDLFYALWIPNIFMERIKSDDLWSLFDPDVCGDLSSYYDKADEKSYTDLYLKLEKEKKYTKQIRARELWEMVFEANKQKGMPYLCSSDYVNQMNMQKNIGVIKSSNLCVSGDTVILTDNGYKNIKFLSNKNKGFHTIWNGYEYKMAKFAQTGIDKKLLKISFTDGVELKCTPEHIFTIYSNIEKNEIINCQANELKIGNILLLHNFPIIDNNQILLFNNLENRLIWLSGYLDAEAILLKNNSIWLIQTNSDDKNYLMTIKLLCNTMGSNPFIICHNDKNAINYNLKNEDTAYYNLKNEDALNNNLKNEDVLNNNLKNEDDGLIKNNTYSLLFSISDIQNLCKIGLKTYILNLNDIENYDQTEIPLVIINNIEYLKNTEDTYCFNEPSTHMGIFNGIIANNCSEICIYSDHEQYGVCNLSSINLTQYVIDSYNKEELKMKDNLRSLNNEFPLNPKFDFMKLIETVRVITNNLNHVIEKNYYPTIECKRSNLLNRPIGIGMQGLADVYIKFRVPFTSDKAKKLNKEIAECMYFAALSQSTKLCRSEYLELCNKCKNEGIVKYNIYNPDFTDKYITFTSVKDIPKNICAYPSMLWNGGSPISKGKFHWEFYNNIELCGKFDWESLREHIKIYGVKNSLLIALMPTATTSQFLGSNESFLPYTSNFYSRKTLVGSFLVFNNWLIHDLYKLKLWNERVKDFIVLSQGSIQYINEIPKDIKDIYKTVWEINQDELIQQAIDRQPFVDQAQSLNWYMSDVSLSDFTRLSFKAWNGKLKTWKYYLHSKPAITPQYFSIDPSVQKLLSDEKNNLNNKNSDSSNSAGSSNSASSSNSAGSSNSASSSNSVDNSDESDNSDELICLVCSS